MASEVHDSNVPVGQFHYHLWFNLKPDASEEEAIQVARTFLNEQVSTGQISAFRLLRNADEPANVNLPRFLALIDFRDRHHFSTAFSALRRDGIHSGFHGELMRMVSDFRVEFMETLEESVHEDKPTPET